jgi:peptidoglycan lytic transglycosylase
MRNTNSVVPGTQTRSRTAFALIAATLLVGGSISDASAKSRHRHHHHHHAHKAQAPGTSWLDSNASIGSQSTGRGFSGKASYYGNESGSRTASGQRFNQNAMTAAHRSLPFGTKLRVTHRGQSVIVTVNDRGPFIRGRVLDLSKGAARAIGLTGAGVGHVTAEVVS